MRICSSIAEVRAACVAARARGKTLGLVPTMGALHEGHLSLVRAAKAKCDAAVVSIFVNPTQFGPREDLAKYPRPFERDCSMLQNEGIDILFTPSAVEMYPQGSVTWVTVEGLSDKLDGRSRPGHFRGVTTVVAKLFNIVEPQVAFFGQKDAAQLAIIRRLVRDLHFPIEIVAGPIVREAEGLAMSSRNAYLNKNERTRALVLQKTLQRAEAQFRAGERNAGKIISGARVTFPSDPHVRLDYLEIVDPDTLEAIETISSQALIAIAAFIGTTRLIDNLLLQA